MYPEYGAPVILPAFIIKRSEPYLYHFLKKINIFVERSKTSNNRTLFLTRKAKKFGINTVCCWKVGRMWRRKTGMPDDITVGRFFQGNGVFHCQR